MDAVESYLNGYLEMLNSWNVGGISVTEFQMAGKEERADIEKAAKELGKRLVRAIAENETFPEQIAAHELYFSALKYVVSSDQARFKYEYEYWKEHLT